MAAAVGVAAAASTRLLLLLHCSAAAANLLHEAVDDVSILHTQLQAAQATGYTTQAAHRCKSTSNAAGWQRRRAGANGMHAATSVAAAARMRVHHPTTSKHSTLRAPSMMVCVRNACTDGRHVCQVLLELQAMPLSVFKRQLATEQH